MPLLTDTLDAVYTSLSAVGSGWTLNTAVTKRLFPRRDLEDIRPLSGDAVLDIFPGPVAEEKQDRAGSWLKTVDINIVLMTPADSDADSVVESHLDTIDDIRGHVRALKMNGLSLSEIEQDQAYDFDLLHVAGLLSTVLTLRYKGF